MSESHLPPGTKACKECEAPVAVDGPNHVGAGDCRAAQRKEIRRLRDDNTRLKGRVDEYGKMHGDAGMQLRTRRQTMAQRARTSADAEYDVRFRSGVCTCVHATHDWWRGRPCAKHG